MPLTKTKCNDRLITNLSRITLICSLGGVSSGLVWSGLVWSGDDSTDSPTTVQIDGAATQELQVHLDVESKVAAGSNAIDSVAATSNVVSGIVGGSSGNSTLSTTERL